VLVFLGVFLEVFLEVFLAVCLAVCLAVFQRFWVLWEETVVERQLMRWSPASSLVGRAGFFGCLKL
jgi:hypothetical protein